MNNPNIHSQILTILTFLLGEKKKKRTIKSFYRKEKLTKRQVEILQYGHSPSSSLSKQRLQGRDGKNTGQTTGRPGFEFSSSDTNYVTLPKRFNLSEHQFFHL